MVHRKKLAHAPKQGEDIMRTKVNSVSTRPTFRKSFDVPAAEFRMGFVAQFKRPCAIFSLFTFAFLILIGAPVSVKAQDAYGSIYFSQNSDGGYAAGWGWNYGDLGMARQAARNECRSRGGTNCFEVQWFRNACGALAVGSGNGYGHDWDTSRNAARNGALNQCRRYNQNCSVIMVECAGN